MEKQRETERGRKREREGGRKREGENKTSVFIGSYVHILVLPK